MSWKDFQHLDDESLLEYYHATRNPNAFRQLYTRHKDSLYRYCAQMNLACAGAVLEALWNRLLESPPQLHGRRLRSWIFIRANQLLRQYAGQDPDTPDAAPVSDNKLLAAIQQLPTIERNVLLLHMECGLPLATVADIEKTSLKKCREFYNRGKERLEEILHGPQRQPWRIEEVSEVTV
ncbi:DNA-directed RNA polymerase specialized sigma subunit, sigma24 family [Microbulbifer donghaiensis]|uniref:DNA-directed RNA polymerase specialized sigma subunit, sigma24 family n=1 Tax=Microbulbifer donghaiensis TaxID=494016 RepID=A0A1M5G939_9GAMM|nr:sigma factor-like helix-turn-helix DNA-binding protein [Microbulbifer donghaiensis]SHG00204.1 DNA-directed RNA polymerase specialized sigma subunit, sigma24 family [Microbulbifer donghaiensis]